MRLACPHCAETYIASESDLEVLKIEDNSEPVEFVRAKGCQKCNNTGYSGREGIFEMMPLVTKMKSLVHEKADLEKFKAIMVEKGMKSLFEAAKERVVAKKTTLEEFLRVVPREQ